MFVILDPGHGGSDPGGGSNSFWKEKDLNFKGTVGRMTENL